MRLKFSLFMFFLLLINARLLAQHTLFVQAEAVAAEKVLPGLSYSSVADTLKARQELNNIIRGLQEEGYLLAGVMEFTPGQDTSRALISVGPAFHWARLQPGNVEKAWLNKTSWREGAYVQQAFRYQQVARLMQQIQREAENSGYPFAALGLDALKLDGNFLEANLQLERGPFIVFDTLQVKGDAPLSVKFLSAHLGIREGEAYHQQRVDEIEGRMRKLPYLSLQESPRLSFQNDQATVYLQLKKKRANVLDGIVGLLPDPQQAGRMLLTGQLDLQLYNPFGGGKQLEMHWQRLNRQSQNLEAAYHHPYLLGSPLSLKLGFQLLKEEKDFVNRQLDLETAFRQGAYNSLSLLASQKEARLLGEATHNLVADFSLWQYGLGFQRQRLDNPLMPLKGYQFSFDLLAGQKKIRNAQSGHDKNGQQTMPAKSLQLKGTAGLEYYLPLGNQFVWAHRLEGGFLEDEQLYLNDLYRLGGFSSLRGFREKAFFAGRYGLSRLELRYLAGSQTNLFLFYDQLWMEQKLRNLHVNDWPLGLGSGLSLATKSGTFNFVYGLGRSESQPLAFTKSQVHFGYLSRF